MVIKHEKNNGKLKIFIFLIFLSVLIGVFVFNLPKLINKNTEVNLIQLGKISKSEFVTGFIIRDEEIVNIDSKNVLKAMIKEGEKVSKGEILFKYYSAEENEKKDKIKKIDKKISAEIEKNEKDSFSAETKNIDKEILNLLELKTKINDTMKIEEYMNDIEELINKKSKYIGEFSENGSELKKLINERKNIEKEVESLGKTIKSPKSGILSYKIDGYEETAKTDDLSKYDINFLNKADQKINQYINHSTEKVKIVNNFNSYIVIPSNSNETQNAKEGQKINLKINSNLIIEAKIKKINNKEDKTKVLVLEINEGLKDLLEYRVIDLEIIWWNKTGNKILKSSLIKIGEFTYIIKDFNGYKQYILVKVLKESDEYAIIVNYTSSELKGKNISKSISKNFNIYDNIIVNPSEEEINEFKKTTK